MISNPTLRSVHVAPIDAVNLGLQSTFAYRYWLIVGSEISRRLDSLWEKHSTERAEFTNP